MVGDSNFISCGVEEDNASEEGEWCVQILRLKSVVYCRPAVSIEHLLTGIFPFRGVHFN